MDSPIIPFEEGWRMLEVKGITHLQTIVEEGLHANFSNDVYIELYATVYNMCTQRAPYSYSHQLYTGYCKAVSDYLTQKVLPAVMGKHDEFMLAELVRRWSNHEIMIRWLSHFFRYLDRYHVKRLSLQPLQDVGVNAFKTIVFDEVKKDARRAILELIQKDRHNEPVDNMLLKNVINIFVLMGQEQMETYIRDFEDQFIDETGLFYQREASKWIEEDSCSDYMQKAEARLLQEERRVELYLHQSTQRKLLDRCHEELLVTHQAQLLSKENSGVMVLLRDNMTEDLTRMFRLFNRVPSTLSPIAAAVRDHFRETGMTLLKEHENTKDLGLYVPRLIELHDKCTQLIVHSFGGNPAFHRAMKEAFEVFVNKSIVRQAPAEEGKAPARAGAGSSKPCVDKSSCSELLASYCDAILKKGGEKMTDDAVEETLEKVVRLFAYLSDKDLFSEYYRKQLAKRLLLSRSASDELERSMISKLKLRCGAQFTSKLEGMVTDMNLSEEIQSSFKGFLNANHIQLRCDLSMQVLTTGFWPTYKAEELALPGELAHCVEVFRSFYDTRTNHRRLRWIHTLGTIHLKGSLKTPHEFICSSYQACMLLLFNNSSQLAFHDLVTGLNLPKDEVKRTVRTLSSGKYKLLLFKGDDLHPDSPILLNEKFTDRQRRIRLPWMSKVTKEDREETDRTVTEDRKLAIEAAIVRVMKSRKTLEHTKLLLEVTQQLMQHFKPDPKVIKRRIEDLISRDYLERDTENQNVYHYLA